MVALSAAIGIIWLTFWVYWLVSAVGSKAGSRSRRARAPGLVVVLVFVVLRTFGVNGIDHLSVHSTAVKVIGAILFAAGLGLAVWARVHLGRNWGMPMTRKDEPELVTSGPYRHIRHPIYSGILLAILGTALAINVAWLIAVLVLGGYFVYSATVEERMLTVAFPTQYPRYRASTRMLIPFVL